jgi:hypothetical protein
MPRRDYQPVEAGDDEECGPPWPFPLAVDAEVAALGVAPADGDGLACPFDPFALADGAGAVVPPGVIATARVGPVPRDAFGVLDAELPPLSAWVPTCPAPEEDGACGAAQRVNGACGPPVRAMATVTKKAARTAMEPKPMNRRTWCRRPEGSAKTGLESTRES